MCSKTTETSFHYSSQYVPVAFREQSMGPPVANLAPANPHALSQRLNNPQNEFMETMLSTGQIMLSGKTDRDLMFLFSPLGTSCPSHLKRRPSVRCRGSPRSGCTTGLFVYLFIPSDKTWAESEGKQCTQRTGAIFSLELLTTTELAQSTHPSWTETRLSEPKQLKQLLAKDAQVQPTLHWSRWRQITKPFDCFH